MGSYRGRLEIIADILRVVSGSPKKTHIMYGANLSFKVLQRYLAEVAEASLISFDGERRCYVLTAKGREFLEDFAELQKHAEVVEAKKRALASSLSMKVMP